MRSGSSDLFKRRLVGINFGCHKVGGFLTESSYDSVIGRGEVLEIF